MPNWCNNVVEISHEDPAMVERVRKAFDAGSLLEEFIPVPADLQITASPGTTDEALREQYDANIAKHGYATWYEFCVNEWGTKWDIGSDGQPAQDLGTDFGKGLILNFDSAWSPPVGAFEKLSEMGFSIRAYYYEPGMCYAGVWEDGNDDYYDLSGLDSNAAKEALPDELDIMFAISENMAEWEEMNAEGEDD
jgi:hypothetical protein